MRDNNDLLGGIKQTNGPLFASLLGVKKSFQHHFNGDMAKGFDVFPLVPHDAPKDSIKNDRNTKGLTYPYAYWKMTDVSLVIDEQNKKTIRRRGSEYAGTASNTSYSIGYFFPARIECSCIYETNQLTDALAFMERYLIMMGTEALNFKINLPMGRDQASQELNIATWTCRTFSESLNVAMPEVVIDEESSPYVFRYELPFSVRTKIGTHKEVAKFNNEGEIQFEMSPDGVPSNE